MLEMYDIEEKAFEYMSNNGIKPRFVLLDTATLKEFSKSLAPKEKIEFLTDSAEEPPNVSVVHLLADIDLKILEVNTPDRLFEVVG